jgi:hypothetical protein
MSAARTAIGMHATEVRARPSRRVATAPVAKAGRVAATAAPVPAAAMALGQRRHRQYRPQHTGRNKGALASDIHDDLLNPPRSLGGLSLTLKRWTLQYSTRFTSFGGQIREPNGA